MSADRLCVACVETLDVDGAALSVIHDGASRGTFGASSELSRRLDDFQFTYGEGPCLDAYRGRQPVLVADLRGAAGQRWPAFTASALDEGIRAVFALPVSVASATVGALDLYRTRQGPLSTDQLGGGRLAAELAALPLLDLIGAMTRDDGPATDRSELADQPTVVAGPVGDGLDQLASLQRIEVYQATGMMMDAWDLSSGQALVRLRAYAYTAGVTASELAAAIVERRLPLDGSGEWPPASPGEQASWRSPR